MRRRRPLAVAVSAAVAAGLSLLALGGCSSGVTETGYEPRKLGMSDGMRKALYAPKYSPEAAQAAAEGGADSRNRKPGFLQ